MGQDRLLTTNDAAQELGVHQSRIYALIKANRLPATLFGKSWMIKESDLDLVRERKPGRPPKQTVENKSKNK